MHFKQNNRVDHRDNPQIQSLISSIQSLSAYNSQSYTQTKSFNEVQNKKMKPNVATSLYFSPKIAETINIIKSGDELLKIVKGNSIIVSGKSYKLSKNFKSTGALPVSEKGNKSKSLQLNFSRGEELSIYPNVLNFPNIFEDVSDTESNPQKDEINSGHQVHLAFMFASPLIMTCMDNGQITTKPMVKLEYENEIENILKSLGEVNKNIKCIKSVATLDKFQQCLGEMPLALHFTGHGLKSDYFGRERMKEGDVLVFEDAKGKAQYVSVEDLKKILQAAPRQPEFVFVSSCHSFSVGAVFRNAGAKHVICVKRKEQILDDVAAMFSQSFYTSFFGSQSTVCEAFKFAQATVSAKTAKDEYLRDEYMKFSLLTFENKKEHSCSHLYKLPSGKPQEVREVPEYRDIPSKVEHFVGRKTDLYSITCYLYEFRLL